MSFLTQITTYTTLAASQARGVGNYLILSKTSVQF